MNTSEVTECILKARQNDQTAYNTIFNSYWDSVYAYLLQRTSNENEAEEIAIETFTKAFDRLDLYDTNQPFISWIITLAKNHHIDRHRKSKNLKTSYVEDEIDLSHTLKSESLSPEELMISDQNLDHLLGQIRLLKKQYRSLLILRYFENKSLKEIEEEIQEPASRIRVKLFRAKKMLATLLERETN